MVDHWARSIPALWAAQVARTPAAVALTFEDLSMTYREVDQALTDWRTGLPATGAGPGQRVVLPFTRSAQAITAILAVLKTGAAYVPIDPALPSARIEFVLGDAAPVAAITTPDWPSGSPATTCRSSDIADPAVAANPARPCRRRPRTTSPT